MLRTQTSEMPWLEVTIPSDEATQELLVAALEPLGYDSFWQEPGQLKAYIAAERYDVLALGAVCAELGTMADDPVALPNVNWNAQWEADWQPVAVGQFAYIHPEHQPALPGYRVTLCVQPQMAFGTGHHPTTRLVIAALEHLPLVDARVLDLGSGTGVLGLLALKLGAAHATLVDIEPWAADNAHENLARNGLDPARASILEGDASVVPAGQFDLILANLNRNLLIDHAAFLAERLAPDGTLLVSGFFDLDGPRIVQNFSVHALQHQRTWEADHWLCQQYTRDR